MNSIIMLYPTVQPGQDICSVGLNAWSVNNLKVRKPIGEGLMFPLIDADTHENSVKLFNKLDWLPIDDIIRIRKLSMLYKINQGHCPAYFNKYIEHISNTHNYNTRSVSNNNITTPACKRNSGLRTFHSSACRLWNALDPVPKTLSHTNFKKYLFKLYRSMIYFLDHLKICKTF